MWYLSSGICGHPVRREAVLWLGAATVSLTEPLVGSSRFGFTVVLQGRFQVFCFERSCYGTEKRNFVFPFYIVVSCRKEERISDRVYKEKPFILSGR